MTNREDIIRTAQEIAAQYIKAERFQTWTHDFMMQRLMELVAISAAEEREAIANEFWMSVQSDLEHGVKSLNEKASSDFHKNYPSLVSFMDWLNKRGEND